MLVWHFPLTATFSFAKHRKQMANMQEIDLPRKDPVKNMVGKPDDVSLCQIRPAYGIRSKRVSMMWQVMRAIDAIVEYVDSHVIEINVTNPRSVASCGSRHGRDPRGSGRDSGTVGVRINLSCRVGGPLRVDTSATSSYCIQWPTQSPTLPSDRTGSPIPGSVPPAKPESGSSRQSILARNSRRRHSDRSMAAPTSTRP